MKKKKKTIDEQAEALKRKAFILANAPEEIRDILAKAWVIRPELNPDELGTWLKGLSDYLEKTRPN